MRIKLTLSFLLLTFLGNAQQTVGLFLNDSAAFNGFTLLEPTNNTNSYLLDNCGRAVHTWPSTYRPGQEAVMLENGLLLRSIRLASNTFQAGGIGGGLEMLDWAGNQVWFYDYSGDVHHSHHDFEMLPNGNVLLIAWEYKTEPEAVAQGRNPATLIGQLWPDHLIEIQPTFPTGGNIVWEWHVWDHLIQDFDATKANYGVVADHPELVDVNFRMNAGGPQGQADWLHVNSVEYNAQLDQILLSPHNIDEIWVIDHSTTMAESASHSGGLRGHGGDLLYRWGNPEAYDRGLPADQMLYHQHHAHWIAPGLSDEGKIMIFNNGTNRPAGAYSSVDIIVPPTDGNGNYTPLAAGQPYGPATLDWTYTSNPLTDFYSANISSAERLPNGNTLILEGASGHFFEIDPSGNTVWDYVSPMTLNGPLAQGAIVAGNTVFRGHRYPTDYAGFVGMTFDPGVPLELNPLPNTCDLFTGVPNVLFDNGLSLFPNPTSGVLNVALPRHTTGRVSVFGMDGRELISVEMNDKTLVLDVNGLVAGVYFVRVSGGENAVLGKFIVE